MQSNIDPIQELSWDGDYLCVTHNETSGIVSIKDKIHCETCHSTSCSHAIFLKENAKNGTIDLPEKAIKKTTVGSQWIRIISSRGIPFTFDPNMKNTYAKPVLQRIPSGILAESDDDPCTICGSLLSPDVTNTSTIPLVDKKSSTIVTSNKNFYNAIRSLHTLRLTSQ